MVTLNTTYELALESIVKQFRETPTTIGCTVPRPMSCIVPRPVSCIPSEGMNDLTIRIYYTPFWKRPGSFLDTWFSPPNIADLVWNYVKEPCTARWIESSSSHLPWSETLFQRFQSKERPREVICLQERHRIGYIWHQEKRPWPNATANAFDAW